MSYEERAGEDRPTTARLREVLDRASRVVIVEASPSEADSVDLPRLTVTGAEIGELAQRLAIVDGGTGDMCRCSGWPTITVYGTQGDPIARWTLHHQAGLRGMGDCDADLRDGPALTAWLAERGLTGSRRVQEELAKEETEEERRRMRWIRAAPDGLGQAAADVARPPARDYDAWSRGSQHAGERLGALARQQYPDSRERIRLLPAWAGISARRSSGGLQWYDMAVLRQLLTEDPGLVLAACAVSPLSPDQLDGAAELFSALEWTRAQGRQLPEPLRSLLIEHIRADGTDAMRFRMQHGYYGAERTV
ncbi:hypothetical protein QFZ82_007449 [Streptomyces sp. V4I23]|uniref:hypothetical protein n=1 Tax=Streptomyces sp. V4I23 TaxID=3042282 RepID=UPI00278A0591|nr:hypothetical protein [Streptomyces sp. V4I23]MDQ1012964.1 hypothetical protein [Streptomyces sp. V4I23]